MRREFEPLRFTPGKRGGGLSQAQISEADFVQHFQFGNDLWSIDEKCQRLAHRELQNLMDVFVVVTDFQDAALEARAAAFRAESSSPRSAYCAVWRRTSAGICRSACGDCSEPECATLR